LIEEVSDMPKCLAQQLILFTLDLLTIRVHVESCAECKKKYKEMLAHAAQTAKPQ